MSRRADRRLPFAPVDARYFNASPEERCAGFTAKDRHDGTLARVLGVSRRSVVRWRRLGVPDRHADAVAVAVGAHPSELWDW